MQKINLTQQQKDKLSAVLKRHATYAAFSATRVDAFEYTATLGVRVCPYCNINYTYTVYDRTGKGGAKQAGPSLVLRPDLDHFVPKSSVSGLSLTQENLVPACQQCNSRIKGRLVFSAATHIHPFLDDFHAIKRFAIILKGPDLLARDNFEIGFANRSSVTEAVARADRTIKDLKLKARYQYHKDEVVDLFRKARFYHRNKLREIQDLLNTRDLRRHLFRSETKTINETPLSKLRLDTLKVVLRKS